METSNEWLSGEQMSFWAKMRYIKIMESRFRVRSGLLFAYAGAFMIASTTGAVIGKGGIRGVIGYAVCLAISFLLIYAAFRVRKANAARLEEIADGKFQWKYDTVKEILPDRYPKPCRILVTSEKDTPVYVLQAYFYFKPEVNVFVVKPENPETGREIVAFIG